jgi:hypothetical protein
MRVVAALVMLLCVVSVQGNNQYYPIPNYELRRPMQYYFHLLELKFKFNPMLANLQNSPTSCSSKTGPFCSLTGHEPFQTHEIRSELLTDNERNIQIILQAQHKQNH